jgi:hypothetical protein
MRNILLAVTLLLFAAPQAGAQAVLVISSEPREALVRDALATPYAEAMLAPLVEAVRRNADAACLRDEGLDDAAILMRGRVLLAQGGIRMFKGFDEAFDRAAWQAALTASAGAEAIAEIERLERDPAIRHLNGLHRTRQFADWMDMLVEMFDRYVKVARVRLDPISPISRGEQGPTHPGEAADAAVRSYVEANPSPAIERYLDLMDATHDAMDKGMSPAVGDKIGPMKIFAGADRALAELCIGRR